MKSSTPREVSLADYVPLWRTLADGGVTALVTPALDYVGVVELSTVDARFASDEAVAGLGEALRALVAGSEDGWTLHFLYRVSTDVDDAISTYESVSARQPLTAALRSYIDARVDWLRHQSLRRARLFLAFSRGEGRGPRAPAGVRMLFANLAKHSVEAHRAELSALKAMRNALKARLDAAGLAMRELEPKEVRGLFFSLLNPNHVLAHQRPPEVLVRANLFDDESIARVGAELREYTESEQLCLEDVVEEVGHLRQEKLLRRVLTLKVLPETGTDYLSAEHLLSLVEKRDGEVRPVDFWLSAVVRVEDQSTAKLKLNASHNLVDLLSSSIPFLKTRSVQRDAEQAAKRAGIEGLFVELNAMSSKVVALSVSLLLDAPTLELLDARTQAARSVFASAGNSQLLLEEVTQLPALLSMLPGAGRYQLRTKVCTSRNAADFLPVVAPWPGCKTPASLLWTPTRDVFAFDFFDPSLPAHHGLVWADTGSGKSVTLGALTLDALAAGHEAILVDNGRSWERLTRLFGGIHLDVDINTALTPFLPFSLVRSDEGRPEAEAVEDVVGFIELCVRDTDLPAFTKLQTRLVARAVSDAYEALRVVPDERPLMRHFREAILRQSRAREVHADDKAIAENLYRRLGLFVGDELYGRFLDRPSTLRFDAPLVCFEMEAVAKSPTAKSIAFATVMRAISARAVAQRKARGGTLKRTLVEIDEGHTWLGQGEVAERFLETSYRVMRKYGVAMWMVSQGLEDFAAMKAGRAILANSALKLLLFHASGHQAVADFFGLTRRATAAFHSLHRRKGQFSDLLLIHGQRQAVVRLALHPLALWVLTTDAKDRKFLEKAHSKNPQLDDVTLLAQLSRRYPQGAPEFSP
jgi:hypothetical protein